MNPFVVLLFFLFPCWLANAQDAENIDASFFRLGVSSRPLGKVDRNDAAASLKAYANTVFKEHGLRENPQVIFFDHLEDLRQEVVFNRLNAISVSVEELMFLGVRTDAVYLPSTSRGVHVRYAIVVHDDSDISNPDDLADRMLVIHQGVRMSLALPWFESVLNGNIKSGTKRFGGHLKNAENPSKGIAQVFFRQSDATLVILEAFEMACELNPQLQNDLRVLAKSPPLIPSVFIFLPSCRGRVKDDAEAAIVGLHTTPGGKQILTVFQNSRMEKRPFSILDDTMKYVEENRLFPEFPSLTGDRP